jgi:hypothetical protein
MTEYNTETCVVCQFNSVCIKSYGYPHDGCTNKFKEAKQQAHELVINSVMAIGQEKEQKKTVILLDALKMIRKIIRNSRELPDLINTIDWTAMNAIHDYLKYEAPNMGNKDD